MGAIKLYVKLVWQLFAIGFMICVPAAAVLYAAWTALPIGHPDPWHAFAACYATYAVVMFGRTFFMVRFNF